MAGVTTKRPKVVLVKKDAVDQAGTFLDGLPEKPKEDFSLRAAVDRLREPIRAALSKGYTYEEVAELLAKQGITISPSTLKNYVPSGTRQSKDKSGASSRKSKKTGEELAIATEEVLEELAESQPEPALSEPTEAEPAQPKRRTRTTKPKAESDTTTKTAAKTKASQPAAKTTSRSTKTTATKGRGRTASKK
jgi:hypothetical protein